MQVVGSLLFNVYLIVSAFVVGVIISLSFPLSRERRFHIVRGWARSILWSLRTLCRLDHVVEGRENIPEEACVVYLKHSSTWETLSEIVECPPQTWVLKRELIWIPIIGTGMLALWCIAINRKAGMSAVEQVIEQGLERLAGGFNVMIFPEGTRMAPGKTRRYGRSGALLAIRAGCPVLPIAHNAGDFWPRRSMLKRPGTIRFCIGPPLDTAGKSADQVNAEAKDWIHRKMAQISPSHSYPVAGSGGQVSGAR